MTPKDKAQWPPLLVITLEKGKVSALWRGDISTVPTEYISLAESEAREKAAEERARAEAFEEAASYLYTNDSSDEQHELVEELARDLRVLAKQSPSAQAEGDV